MARSRSDADRAPVKAQRFLFTSMEMDEETGLYYFGGRVAEKMADKVGGTVRGSSVSVEYPGGVVSDRMLVAANPGKIVDIQGRGGRKE